VASDTLKVASFGGGLNFSGNPASIRDDEWTWADGWWAREGTAEVLPQYTQVSDGSWLTATYAPLGIVQNPFSYRDAALIGTVSSNAANVVKLTSMSSTGTATDIPWDTIGTKPCGVTNNLLGLLGSAFLNGYLVLSYGTTSSTNTSVIKTSDGATFSSIKPTATLTPAMLASFGSHAIAAGIGQTQAGVRTVLISDANDPTVWDPAISNSADSLVMDDAESGVTAMLRMDANSLGLWTRRGQHVLSPTGGIPPFTRQWVGTQGAWPAVSGSNDPALILHSLAGETPYGVVIRGPDDFYLGQQKAGKGMFAYFLAQETVASLFQWFPQYVWHAARGFVILPGQFGSGSPGVRGEYLLWDLQRSVFMRRTFQPPSSAIIRHAFLLDNLNGTVAPLQGRHWLVAGDGKVYTEDASGTAQSGAFVDTKDFAFGDPSRTDLVTKIKVDWEPLTNSSTDALDIYAVAHDDASKGVRGSAGLATANVTNAMALVGTLTGGASELVCRLQGKFVRFRFQQNSGRVRIRGFTIEHQADSTKAS